MADFQNVSIQSLAALQNIFCFVFEQSIMFHNVQNIYNVFYFKTSSMCIFNAVKKQSGIAFIVDALFGYFTYLHSLWILVATEYAWIDTYGNTLGQLQFGGSLLMEF